MTSGLVLLGVVAGLVWGQDTDRYGDPLPEGAVLRLGTRRLRHEGQVLSVAYSPDGRMIASGGYDRVIRVWSAPQGKRLLTLAGHEGWVTAIAFSPDGKTLATGDSLAGLRLWGVPSGKVLRILRGHGGATGSVRFSPDSRFLFSGGKDRKIHVWDVETGKKIRSLSGHEAAIRDLSFSPDGRLMASSGADKAIRFWVQDGEGWKESRRVKSGDVSSLSFSKDGALLAVASLQAGAFLLDVAKGSRAAWLGDLRGPVSCIRFSPDGTRLVTGHRDTTVRTWNVSRADSGNVRVELTGTLSGHEARVNAVAYAPDGKTVVSVGSDRTLRLWDPQTGKERGTLHRHSHEVSSVARTLGGDLVVSGSNDRTIRVWNGQTGEWIRTLRGHRSPVDSLSLSPKGDRLISGSRDRTIRLWNPRTGENLGSIGGEGVPAVHVLYSNDGRRIFAAGALPEIGIWDSATGKKLHGLSGHEGAVFALMETADGLWLVSTGSDRTIRFWEPESGKELLKLENPRWPVTALAVSPDGRFMATAGLHQGYLQLWSMRAPQMPGGPPRVERMTTSGKLQVPEGSVTSLAISPDGMFLVCALYGKKKVHRWELATGKEVSSLDSGDGWPRALRFDSGGTRLIGGLSDTTLLVWDPLKAGGGRRPTDPEFSPTLIKRWWKELGNENAWGAQESVSTWIRLALSGELELEASVSFLRTAVGSSKADPLKEVLDRLDDDAIAVREEATEELQRLGTSIVPALRSVLTGNPTEETRSRIEFVLGRLKKEAPSVFLLPGDALRRTRAVIILERLGARSADARAILSTLTVGPAYLRQTRQAKGALERIKSVK